MLSGLSMDLRPLRRSRDLRLLFGGAVLSQLGTAVVTVTAGLQVYRLTHSSLAVGGISGVAVVPLIAGVLAGGVAADAWDRRWLVIAAPACVGLASAGLAVYAATGGTSLWVVYGLLAVSAGMAGLGGPAQTAALPNLVGQDLLPATFALSATVRQLASLVGPAVGGLLVAQLGLTSGYAAAAALGAGCALVVLGVRPLPPEGARIRVGLSAFVDGLRYARRSALVIALMLIDADATVFGMPQALFPALGLVTFHAGPTGVGLLYAAPAAGALLGAATSGWVGSVRHAGRAVLAAVAVWGLAIAAVGVVPVLWAALGLLALAGAADLVSEILRNSLLQRSVPDQLRGRLSALLLAQTNGAPALGNLEAGTVATLVTPGFSIISGGLACVAGGVILGGLLPVLRHARLGPAPEPAPRG
jgi:ENTS family enterobactin (siderophore) exporter